MGHSKNPRKSTNQPKKGALDTNEDKGIEETAKPEESEQAISADETQGQAQATEGSTEQEAKTSEEKPEQAPSEEEVTPEEEIEEAPEEESPEEAEEKPRRGKTPEEEEIVEERTYTIPLRRAWISPRKKRVPKAVRMVRSYIQRHMKIETGPKTGEEEEEERLVISNEVNEKLWDRGIEKPPRNIRVRAVKDKEGTVTLYLAEGD